MAFVSITQGLKRVLPGLTECHVGGTTVAEIIAEMDRRHRGFAAHVVDEHGALRRHVNVVVGDSLITDRAQLSDPVYRDDQVCFVQLSSQREAVLS